MPFVLGILNRLCQPQVIIIKINVSFAVDRQNEINIQAQREATTIF